MKILVCPDSFKGTMTAPEAAEAIRQGIAGALPGAEVDLLPIGDGGEGTAKAIAASLPGCRTVSCETTDPLGRPVIASYLITNDATAIIESAAASGLTLITPDERDIMRSDTYGTGLLIADAFRRGCRRFLICMGGTATCDGGEGALRAIRENIAATERLDFLLLCDVENPMCGLRGAAAVFGPQKGATPEMVELLDARLRTLAESYRRENGVDPSGMRYAGAAGGLSGMLMACFGARPVSGISAVLDILDFDRHLKGTDLVITGEGRADATTLSGKAPYGILSRARGIPVVLFCGRVANREELLAGGFRDAVEVSPFHPDPAVSPQSYLRSAVCSYFSKNNL